MIKRIILITVFTIAGLFQAHAESDLDYGLYLFRRGSYEASILELERFIFHNPDDDCLAHAKLVASLSYAHQSQWERALYLLRDIPRTSKESSKEDSSEYSPEYFSEGSSGLLCEAKFHELNILFRQRRAADFMLQRESLLVLCPGLDHRLKQHLDAMSVALAIYDMNWTEALDEVNGSSDLPDRVSISLRGELEEAIGHRDKSPVLGGVLSLVPGLGHLYAGRPVDGLKSLLINGAGISLTVFSFTQEQPALGAVFGIVEGVLYISNIYGGVNAVQQENARYAVGKRDEMLKNIPSPPLDIISIREEFDF